LCRYVFGDELKPGEPWLCVGHGDARQRHLLHPQIGMDVDLRRLDGFVTEPEGDDRLVDAVLQQLHRRTVPKDVGTDALARERWHDAAAV
jgi:hypothetical protein